MTTTTIDCQTCPVRGTHCGDCFVPVLARIWLEEPAPRAEPVAGGAPLDEAELAAVNAFVRAGLVPPGEAAAARATVEPTHLGRVAAG